ncbi:MAG: electron transfer flavoprotein subunit alpha/FixB family protein [Oligoflexales bacterium]
MKILVFIEQRDGHIKAASLEGLSKAIELSSADQVRAIVVGAKSEQCTEALQNHGASHIYMADDAQHIHYNVETWSATVQHALNDFEPELVLGMATPMGRDLFPRLAARDKTAIITDLIEFDGSEGVKPMYAGKVLAKVGFEGNGRRYVTLRPNVFSTIEKASTAQITKIDMPAASTRLITKNVLKGESEQLDLTEASRIISGGRAMGNKENFSILHDCAKTINATVGASRAAVDSGYATHDQQVGQTGKTVNPALYIACGISGSIQHMAGMRTSQVIIAINNDPEAPIFKVATYGIVADLFEAVPVLTKALSELNLA